MSTDQDGLLVQLGNQKKLCLSNDLLLQDVLAPLSVLQSVMARGVQGPQWRQRVEKDEAIELFESSSGGVGASAAEYAVVLKLELKCHLNEVFNALVADDVPTYEASMRGRFGKKFRKGAILHRFEHDEAHTKVLVKTATFANSLAKDVEFNFTDYRLRNIAARTVTRVTKSLPREFHDRLSKNSVLGGAREIIACTHAEYGGPGKTRVFFYASCCVDDESGSQFGKKSSSIGSGMDKPMSFVVGLAKSMAALQDVIRRRRLGFQSFIYSSNKAPAARAAKKCKVCEKSLNVLHGDHHCQMCGFRTCNTCSDVVEVEPTPGALRTNRVCKMCVDLTDRCVFDDLDLDLLGAPVVAEMATLPSFHHLQIAAQRGSGTRGAHDTSSGDTDQKVIEYLFSADPSKQSQALEVIGVSRLTADSRSRGGNDSFVDSSSSERELRGLRQHREADAGKGGASERRRLRGGRVRQPPRLPAGVRRGAADARGAASNRQRADPARRDRADRVPAAVVQERRVQHRARDRGQDHGVPQRVPLSGDQGHAVRGPRHPLPRVLLCRARGLPLLRELPHRGAAVTGRWHRRVARRDGQGVQEVHHEPPVRAHGGDGQSGLRALLRAAKTVGAVSVLKEEWRMLTGRRGKDLTGVLCAEDAGGKSDADEKHLPAFVFPRVSRSWLSVQSGGGAGGKHGR